MSTFSVQRSWQQFVISKVSAIQRSRANVLAVTPQQYSVTPQQYWYRALYLLLVDHFSRELSDRLLSYSTGSWVNTSYLHTSYHLTEKILTGFTMPTATT